MYTASSWVSLLLVLPLLLILTKNLPAFPKPSAAFEDVFFKVFENELEPGPSRKTVEAETVSRWEGSPDRGGEDPT